jgi:antitoxin (DNA-binding transcriptional repressor) of toxin-antitoxin stability system
MKALNISDFRQQCLSLIDELPAEGVLITRRGQPVAKILPIRAHNADLIGVAKGRLGAQPGDDLFSTGEEWNAES